MTRQWQFVFTVKGNTLLYSTVLNNAAYFGLYNNI